jgi:hypothetical protein
MRGAINGLKSVVYKIVFIPPELRGIADEIRTFETKETDVAGACGRKARGFSPGPFYQ